MIRANMRLRRTLIALATGSAVAIVLTGCGGGGDDGGTTSPTATFPVASAYAAYLTGARSESFTSSGSAQGVAYSASGTMTQTAAVNDTFDGKAVTSNTRSYSATATAQSQTIPISLSAKQYYSNGVLVGSSANGLFTAVTATALPASASVGAQGNLYSATTYESSRRVTVLGTASTAYALESDDRTDSIILRLTLTGTGASTPQVTRLRITASGVVSTVSEPLQISGTNQTLVYK